MLFAVLVAAALSATPAPGSAGASAPADGSYTYAITQNGNDVGKSSITIKRADVGLTIHETETVAPYSWVIDEIFDSTTLSPKAYTGVYARGTDTSTVHAAFDRGGATVTIEGTEGTAPLPNPPGVKEAYVHEGMLMSGFAMLPSQIHASKVTQFSLIEPRAVLQFLARVDLHPSASRPSGVPPSDALLSITGSVNVDEWYDPATLVLHALSMPTQQVLITLTK